MNFGLDDRSEPETAQMDARLPTLRTFVVRRFEPLKQAQGTYEIEEILVESHTVMVEEDGSLAFVMYSIWMGQVLPQKHRLIKTYIDVTERAEYKASKFLH